MKPVGGMGLIARHPGGSQQRSWSSRDPASFLDSMKSWITRDSCRVPYGPFAARMFAPASCLRSQAFAGMTAMEAAA
jgi:hypothetical protein